MNLLLDTHILIWTLNDDTKLSKKAREMICDENNIVFYSVISLWEISIKHSAHPENVEFSSRDIISYCSKANLYPLELRDKHILSLETLRREENAPPHHDPFDRMLIAQAKSENMVFLTHDSLLPYYMENCIISV